MCNADLFVLFSFRRMYNVFTVEQAFKKPERLVCSPAHARVPMTRTVKRNSESLKSIR